jgi:hypothetical protein
VCRTHEGCTSCRVVSKCRFYCCSNAVSSAHQEVKATKSQFLLFPRGGDSPARRSTEKVQVGLEVEGGGCGQSGSQLYPAPSSSPLQGLHGQPCLPTAHALSCHLPPQCSSAEHFAQSSSSHSLVSNPAAPPRGDKGPHPLFPHSSRGSFPPGAAGKQSWITGEVCRASGTPGHSQGPPPSLGRMRMGTDGTRQEEKAGQRTGFRMPGVGAGWQELGEASWKHPGWCSGRAGSLQQGSC